MYIAFLIDTVPLTQFLDYVDITVASPVLGCYTRNENYDASPTVRAIKEIGSNTLEARVI